MKLLTRSLICAVVLMGLTACGDDSDDPVVSSPVELTAGGGCGDAFFWATTDSGDVAVSVGITARGRSATEATTLQLSIPDDDIEVEVLEGQNLGRNFCTDVLDSEAEPTSRQAAVAGEGTITLDPLPEGSEMSGCGSVSGELELTGLEAEDGTEFAPIQVTSDSIGCYAG